MVFSSGYSVSLVELSSRTLAIAGINDSVNGSLIPKAHYCHH